MQTTAVQQKTCKTSRCSILVLAVIPPAIAALLYAASASEETISATFLVSSFLAYVFVPAVLHDRRRKKSA